MNQKIWSVLGLCIVFAVVLFSIYGLAEQRGYYQSSELLSIEDYRMIIRSVKYGMVLVVLVFASFFLSEVLQEWRIHPMQYLLVGAALSIFYLLLLSLAEHIGLPLLIPSVLLPVSACCFGICISCWPPRAGCI